MFNFSFWQETGRTCCACRGLPGSWISGVNTIKLPETSPWASDPNEKLSKILINLRFSS